VNNWYLHDGLVYRNYKLRQEDILVINGKIAAFGDKAKAGFLERSASITAFNASGYVICRGFLDLHVHLREPGFAEKETIATGTKAAAAGGFTAVCAMPNTNPSLDSPDKLIDFKPRLRKDARVKVIPIAAITKGRAGAELTDFDALIGSGITLFSDDGDPVPTSLLRQAMEKLANSGGVLINHLEEKSLVKPGLFADAIPPQSEYLMLERDLEMAAKTGCRYHAAHLSCAESVELIAAAKRSGLPVTAEVTPHHLTLTINDIGEPQGDFQMKPPLRTEADRSALIEGLRRGVIDAVATDHAPHGREKEQRIGLDSPFGVTGLETAFPALYSNLVLTGMLELEQLLQALTFGPGRVVNQDCDLIPGGAADLVVIDLARQKTVERGHFYSKGTNSPFVGRRLQGWPVLTLVDGEERFNANRAEH
jgi:dihydroorotase